MSKVRRATRKRRPQGEPSNNCQQHFAALTTQERLEWLQRPLVHIGAFVDPPKNAIETPDRRSKRSQIQSKLARLVGWSPKRLASFKRTVTAYHGDPSLENYVQVRLTFPEVEIQIGQLGGIDPLFALEERFRREGIDPQLIAAALDGYEPGIDALSLRLAECLVARTKLPREGRGYIERRRMAIADATVNYLIAVMLEALQRSEEPLRIPASLAVLIREQTCGQNPDLHQAYVSAEKRNTAALLAAQFFARGERIKVRKLAEMANVSIGTAAGWLKDEKFLQALEQFRQLVSSDAFQQQKAMLMTINERARRVQSKTTC